MNLHQRNDFLTYCGGFLFVLLCLALGLAAWAKLTPLSNIHWSVIDVAIGIAAALLMVLLFGFVTTVRNEAEKILGPALASCRWYDLMILASLVGLVEELMFRGVLEPWVAQWNPYVAFIGVNIVFGLLHAVSKTYAVVAAILGGILSGLAYGPGDYNLLRPIVAHAVYDYIGFVWLARTYRRSIHLPEPDDPED